MDLATYLKTHKINLDEFAAKIGSSKASVSRIARGAQNTDRDTIQKIIDATNGEVTADSFFMLPPGASEGDGGEQAESPAKQSAA